MTHCNALVRVELPDRPGALGLVASRIGALKGDIVGIEVIERTESRAVDELAVVLPDDDRIGPLRREIAEVDGVTVLAVQVVEHFANARVETLRAAMATLPAAVRNALQAALATAIEHAPDVRELQDLLVTLGALEDAAVTPR